MARYIDADKLIWQVQDSDKYGTITKQVFISLLQNSETEDVVPVVHAHWEEIAPGGGKLYFRCSNCSTTFAPSHGLVYKYCFYCGAKMDEKEGQR